MFYKKGVLKDFENSQETPMSAQAGLQLYLKRDSGTGVPL